MELGIAEALIGILLGFGSVAVGYGVLQSRVSHLRDEMLKREQESRELDKRLRDMERWQDRTKGAENAKQGRPITETQDSGTEYTKRFKRR